MCIGLDEFPDGETIRGFFGRDGGVLAHELVSVFDSLRKMRLLEYGRDSRNASIPNVMRLCHSQHKDTIGSVRVARRAGT
jgi:hypothetical protein